MFDAIDTKSLKSRACIRWAFVVVLDSQSLELVRAFGIPRGGGWRFLPAGAVTGPPCSGFVRMAMSSPQPAERATEAHLGLPTTDTATATGPLTPPAVTWLPAWPGSCPTLGRAPTAARHHQPARCGVVGTGLLTSPPRPCGGLRHDAQRHDAVKARTAAGDGGGARCHTPCRESARHGPRGPMRQYADSPTSPIAPRPRHPKKPPPPPTKASTTTVPGYAHSLMDEKPIRPCMSAPRVGGSAFAAHGGRMTHTRRPPHQPKRANEWPTARGYRAVVGLDTGAFKMTPGHRVEVAGLTASFVRVALPGWPRPRLGTAARCTG